MGAFALCCAPGVMLAQSASRSMSSASAVRICARSVWEKTLSAGSLMEKQRLYVPSWLTVRSSGAWFARRSSSAASGTGQLSAYSRARKADSATLGSL